MSWEAPGAQHLEVLRLHGLSYDPRSSPSVYGLGRASSHAQICAIGGSRPKIGALWDMPRALGARGAARRRRSPMEPSGHLHGGALLSEAAALSLAQVARSCTDASHVCWVCARICAPHPPFDLESSVLITGIMSCSYCLHVALPWCSHRVQSGEAASPIALAPLIERWEDCSRMVSEGDDYCLKRAAHVVSQLAHPPTAPRPCPESATAHPLGVRRRPAG